MGTRKVSAGTEKPRSGGLLMPLRRLLRDRRGVGAIDNLLRLCARTDVDLSTLKSATRIFCDGLIEFLGMCGQTTFTGFYRRAIDSFDDLEAKRDYFRLFATFSLYATRFNAWHLHLFPWSLGDRYTYRRST